MDLLIDTLNSASNNPIARIAALLLLVAIALAVAYGLFILKWHINNWLYFREVQRRHNEELDSRLEDPVKKAMYNPRLLRRSRVGNEEYDPERHFRREGRTDIKW